MPIRVKCESCKKTLSVKDHLAGKKIKCPNPDCQKVVVVPTASPTKESAAAAPKKVPPGAAPPKKPALPASAPPGAKKPVAGTKPIVKTKPTVEKPGSNGTPVAKAPPSNGAPPKAPEPDPIELPPENVEAEALAAFAEDLKPPEEPEEPKTIEFICEWCDEKVTLPIDMAGKQTQCPNAECKRIIKVPLPKKVEKKDWRKMDKQGPALARINQPEQLQDAWGTEEATKARQKSLLEAGAIKEPPKKGNDLYDVIRRVCYGLCILAFVVVAIAGLWKLRGTNRQKITIDEAKGLVEGKDTKIKTPSLASGEAHRAIALLYLQSNEKYRADWARKYFQGAAGAVELKVAKGHEAVNEQLFLIDLALSQIELGGEPDDILDKARLEWTDVQAELNKTLGNIVTPEVQVIALREVGSRLIEKKKPEIAIALTAALGADARGKKFLPFRQQIAMVAAHGGDVKLLPPADPAAKGFDGHARVGHAEALVRKGDVDGAMKLVKTPGPVKDRLDAALGAAAVAVEKSKEHAATFVDEAMNILKEKNAKINPWQTLELVRLMARIDRVENSKPIANTLPHEFKVRAHLEIFLASCNASKNAIENSDLDKTLVDLETLDAPDKKAPAKQASTAGHTLALAWLTIARHNTALGYNRDDNRKILEDRLKVWTTPPGIDLELLRAMVEVGTYQGTKK